MKQKFTLLSILLLSFTVIVMAQRAPVIPGDFSKAVTKKINAPSPGSKSVMDQLFYEDFSDGGFTDWTVMDNGLTNWMELPFNYAGGEVPEAAMSYNPSFVGISRFVSPIINTTGYTGLSLNFLHYLDVYAADDFYLRVETTSDGGTTWNQAWELFWNEENDYAALEVMEINTPDLGSENFQFCFHFEGDSYNLNYWYIDNISLGEFVSYDAMPVTINGTEGINYEGDDLNISSTVVNLGAETVTFDVLLEIFDDTGLIYETTKAVENLPSTESALVEFDPWVSTPGTSLTATVTTQLEGDENTANDDFSVDFYVISADYQYCIPSGWLTPTYRIFDFSFAGIENNDNGYGADGYNYFVNMVASVEIGGVYELSVTTNPNESITVWIDFNKDFVFDESEEVVYDIETPGNGEPLITDVTIPGFAEPGLTYMRVGAQYYNGSLDDPCADEITGEWEDYTIEISGAAMSYDVAAISIDNYWLAEQGEMVPVATIQNMGIETVSFPVSLYIGSTYSSTVELTNIVSNEQVVVEFDPWNATPGNYIFEVETGLSDDENPANNLLEKGISILDEFPDKKVVGEEGTGTWCGWCIRGLVYMDSMNLKYPETWIGIAVHSGDVMEDSDYLAGMNTYFSGYPSGVINRGETIDPLQFEQYYLMEMERPAPANIYIEDKQFNSTTNELTFTVSSEFLAPVADYRFSAILIENGITGSSPDYDQANYYSGGTYGPMAGYEDLPNPIPAEDMVYDHVGRTVIGEVTGVEGSLPVNIMAGETHSYEFTTTISEDWNENNIEIVGILLDYNTGRIENGAMSHLITRVSEQLNEQSFALYPNPASDKVYIETEDNLERIQLLNISGQLVYEKQVSGTRIEINTSKFITGIYIIKVFSHDQIITKKLVIE